MTTSATAAPASATRPESLDPATGERLGSVTPTAPEAVGAIVAEIARVQPLWAQLRVEDRARYMRRCAQAVIDEFDELVELVAREQGRPRAEVAALELLTAIDALAWTADTAPRVLRDRRLGLWRAQFTLKRARVSHEPLGVIAVIGAGSAPLAQPLGQIAAALAAGNGVVLKPAPRAALAGERIARVVARAGLPEGLVRIVHGDAALGDALIAADVAKVLFTGSRANGRDVAQACALAGKGAVLELGGKDAMLVLDDANVARAVEGAAWAAFAAAGQAHGSVERVYVAREVAERFIDGLVAHARQLAVGDPADARTQVGPLASRERLAHVDELVRDAVAHGATLHCGGPLRPPGLSGAFYAPAVLTGADHAQRVMRERIGGPALTVTVVDSASAAIAHANDSEYGLGASVWTADRYRAARIARELRTAIVWLNDHLPSPAVPQGPWGGTKESGLGRAHGEAGLHNCTEPKLVTWDPPIGRMPWWYPYDDALARAARAVAQLRSLRDSDRERAWREGALAMARVAVRSLRGTRRR